MIAAAMDRPVQPSASRRWPSGESCIDSRGAGLNASATLSGAACAGAKAISAPMTATTKSHGSRICGPPRRSAGGTISPRSFATMDAQQLRRRVAMIKVSVMYPNKPGAPVSTKRTTSTSTCRWSRRAWARRSSSTRSRKALPAAARAIRRLPDPGPSPLRLDRRLPARVRSARAGDHGRHPELHRSGAAGADRRSAGRPGLSRRPAGPRVDAPQPGAFPWSCAPARSPTRC